MGSIGPRGYCRGRVEGIRLDSVEVTESQGEVGSFEASGIFAAFPRTGLAGKLQALGCSFPPVSHNASHTFPGDKLLSRGDGQVQMNYLYDKISGLIAVLGVHDGQLYPCPALSCFWPGASDATLESCRQENRCSKKAVCNRNPQTQCL